MRLNSNQKHDHVSNRLCPACCGIMPAQVYSPFGRMSDLAYMAENIPRLFLESITGVLRNLAPSREPSRNKASRTNIQRFSKRKEYLLHLPRCCEVFGRGTELGARTDLVWSSGIRD